MKPLSDYTSYEDILAVLDHVYNVVENTCPADSSKGVALSRLSSARVEIDLMMLTYSIPRDSRGNRIDPAAAV